MNRLEILHQWHQDDPSDPFNAYALAMEYLSSDALRAQQHFDELLAQHPDYLPTYYHAAALYAALEQPQKAEELYQKGLALALQQQNTKTHQELQRAYRQFQDEMEDW